MRAPATRAAGPLLLLALAACSSSGLSSEEQAARCEQVARQVAKAHLTSTPSATLAGDVAAGLDPLLSRLGSPQVHDPAVRVHQQLHTIETAQRKGLSDKADKAAERAREAIDDLAAACALSESAFLGK